MVTNEQCADQVSLSFPLFFIQLISVGKAFANADEWMTTFANIAQTWQQPEHYDFIFLPSPGMHVSYDKEKTNGCNRATVDVLIFAYRIRDKKETMRITYISCHSFRRTNGNQLPDSQWKVPGDRWRMKIFISVSGFTAG